MVHIHQSFRLTPVWGRGGSSPVPLIMDTIVSGSTFGETGHFQSFCLDEMNCVCMCGGYGWVNVWYNSALKSFARSQCTQGMKNRCSEGRFGASLHQSKSDQEKYKNDGLRAFCSIIRTESACLLGQLGDWW